MDNLQTHSGDPMAIEGAKAPDGREEWPPVIPLSSPHLPRLNLRHLPVWVGAYVAALAAATETPGELTAAMVLVACATATARCLRVEVHPGYTEPTNLWVVVSLPPGNRKSAVHSAATAPLLKWEREQRAIKEAEIKRLVSERKTMETRAKEIRAQAGKQKNRDKARELAGEAADIEAKLPEIPALPQLWTSDATPERLGVLLNEQNERIAWLSAEAGFFDLFRGRYSNGLLNMDLILKTHSGDPERVDRAGRPPVFLENPLTNIGLCPQPDVLRGLATTPGFRGRGLIGRFLYLMPPSPLGFRSLKSNPVPEEVAKAYAAGLHAMLAWEPAKDAQGKTRPHLVRLSAEAHRVWLRFAYTIEAQMRSGGDLEHFTDWAGKAPGAAARLACVLHAVKHAHGTPWESDIDVETMIDAVEIMTVITHHSLAALDMMGADPSIAAARKVWDWIERGQHDGVTMRDAFQALKGTFPRVRGLQEALDVLAERGYLRVIPPPRAGQAAARRQRSVSAPTSCANGSELAGYAYRQLVTH